MRINKYVALSTGLSRRAADTAIAAGRVHINSQTPTPGQNVLPEDTVTLDDSTITPPVKSLTIMLNKPVGYVCSRNGQGSKTIYELLPPDLHHLKPVGRLDKDSSGLLLLTDDGGLAQRLTHPSFAKQKVYEIVLDKPLVRADEKAIVARTVQLEDGPSGFGLKIMGNQRTSWQVTMHEGRNRQIRRTFAARGYDVLLLHRVQLGEYRLLDLAPKAFRRLN